MSCMLRHRVAQLILANSGIRPAILVAGKGKGGMFLFLLFQPIEKIHRALPMHGIS